MHTPGMPRGLPESVSNRKSDQQRNGVRSYLSGSVGCDPGLSVHDELSARHERRIAPLDEVITDDPQHSKAPSSRVELRVAGFL